MFGFGGSKSKIQSAYRKALQSHDPEEMLHASEEAIALTEQADRWPFPDASKNNFFGRMHGTRGLALRELIPSDPPLYTERTVAAMERSLEFFVHEPNEDLAIAYHNTALAYTDRLQGSPKENNRRAIELTEKALTLMGTGIESDFRFTLLSTLASLYADESGEPDADILEHALQLANQALEIRSNRIPPEQYLSAEINLANIYQKRKKGDHSKNLRTAITMMEEAISKIDLYPDPFFKSMAHHNLARMYAEDANSMGKREKIEKALASNEQSLSYLSPHYTPQKWANVMSSRAHYLAERVEGDPEKNLEEALAIMNNALDVLDPDLYPADHQRVLQNLSIIQRSKGISNTNTNHSSAVSTAEEALSLIDKGTQPQKWASAMFNLGAANYMAAAGCSPEKIEKAIDCFEAALKGMNSDESLELWAKCTGNLANAYAERMEGNRADNIERSIELAKVALDRVSPDQFRESWLSGMRNLALNYLSRIRGHPADNIEYAIIAIEEALLIADARSNPDQRSELLEVLSDALERRKRGDNAKNLQRAIDALNEAASIRPFAAGSEPMSRVQAKKGTILRQQRNLKTDQLSEQKTRETSRPKTKITSAEYLLSLEDQANSLSKKDHPSTWKSMQVNLGDAYKFCSPDVSINTADFTKHMISNLRKAVECYENALSVTDKSTNKISAAYLHEKVGSAYALAFLMSEASDYGWSELYKRTEVVESERSAQTLIFLEAYQHAYLKALSLREELEQTRDCFRLNVAIGEAFVWERNWTKATHFFESGIELADTMLADVETGRNDLAEILRYLNQLAEYAPFVALIEGDWHKAIKLNESCRARLLAKALTLRALPISSSERSKLITLQKNLAEEENALVSPETFDRRRPLDKIASIRVQLRESFGRFDIGLEDDSYAINALTDITAKRKIVIVPIISSFGGKLLVFFNEKNELKHEAIPIVDSIELKSLLNEKGELRTKFLRACNEFRGDLEDSDWFDSIDNTRDAVRRLILEPLGEVLAELYEQGKRTIVILTHGALGSLPITVSPAEKSGNPIIDHFGITFSPSLRLSGTVLDNTTNYKTNNILVLAPSEVASESDKIPSATIEADLVQSWFQGETVTRLDERSFADSGLIAQLQQNEIWHFCTHGKFDVRNPLHSRIRIGDFSLTLDELFDAQTSVSPRLVVLSACDTAKFDIDETPHEFVGLPSAFLQLGASGVIAAQWPVSDLATTILMGRMYEFLVGGGLSPLEALRQAQFWLRDATLEVLRGKVSYWHTEDRIGASQLNTLNSRLAEHHLQAESKPFSHPTFWGPFIYYGA